jgi:hypothetical protein
MRAGCLDQAALAVCWTQGLVWPATTPIQADGEFLGYAPASIDILPAKLRFLM